MTLGKVLTEQEIVYALTTRPLDAVTCAESSQQEREISKARSRVGRMAGGFQISSYRTNGKLILSRS